MPSSGARSGTQPSRSERGAGSGEISSGTRLKCKHTTDNPPTVTGRRKLYLCPEGCGLQERSTKQ